jgi:hypothetical protein
LSQSDGADDAGGEQAAFQCAGHDLADRPEFAFPEHLSDLVKPET